MYDLTNLETFEKLTNWLKDIETVRRSLTKIAWSSKEQYCSLNIETIFLLQYGLDKEQLIIVGNKSDLEHERQVTRQRGEKVISFSKPFSLNCKFIFEDSL